MLFSFYCTQAETKSALLSIKSVYSENTSWLPIFMEPFYWMHTQAPKKSNLPSLDSHFEPKLPFFSQVTDKACSSVNLAISRYLRKKRFTFHPWGYSKEYYTSSIGNSKKEGPQIPQTGSSLSMKMFSSSYIYLQSLHSGCHISQQPGPDSWACKLCSHSGPQA